MDLPVVSDIAGGKVDAFESREARITQDRKEQTSAATDLDDSRVRGGEVRQLGR